ncbi:hypothetical protein T484DRAFT_1783979 [Baffinella frigidus]|nr:hypothetical protein T484DRAFT_1783979 [Cryptophyta sp. CCMP2293]
MPDLVGRRGLLAAAMCLCYIMDFAGGAGLTLPAFCPAPLGLRQAAHPSTRHAASKHFPSNPRALHRLASCAAPRRGVSCSASAPSTTTGAAREPPLIVFPGGGIYFWWQAGAVKALEERAAISATHTRLAGASAGSLTAVMAACGCDMDHAFAVASR